MRLNGIKPIERSQIVFADEHEPSLTAVKPGLDRPVSEIASPIDDSEDRTSLILAASALGLAVGLKLNDKMQNLRARLKAPRGEI